MKPCVFPQTAEHTEHIQQQRMGAAHYVHATHLSSSATGGTVKLQCCSLEYGKHHPVYFAL